MLRLNGMEYSLSKALQFTLKVNRKRLLYALISSLLIFIVLTTMFVVWFSYREILLQSELNENFDWYNDQEISAYYSTITSSFTPNYDNDYINQITNELSQEINKIIPNITNQERISACFCVELFNIQNITSVPIDLGLYAFNPILESTLASMLIKGSMPISSNEIVYFCENNLTCLYNINDSITLKGSSSFTAYALNFTISGIIDINKLNDVLVNQSLDLLNWYKLIKYYRYLFSLDGYFMTNSSFQIEILNSYPSLTGGRAFLVDFNYNNEVIKGRKLDSLLRNLRQKTSLNLESEQDELFVTFNDLIIAIGSFQFYWLQETTKIIALSLPFLFLFLFLIKESCNINIHQFINNIGLLDTYGLNKKHIKRIYLVENLLLTFSCSIIGLLIGVLLSNLFIINLEINFKDTWWFIIDPIYLSAFFLILLVLFVTRLTVTNYSINKKLDSISEVKKRRTTNKKESLKLKDFVLLLPGSIALIMGIMLLILVPFEVLTIDFQQFNLLAYLSILTWFFIYLGIILIISSLFRVISYLTIGFWKKIGQKIWQTKKNLRTFALNNIANAGNNYRRTIFFILTMSICFIPGLTMFFSSQQQLTAEAYLESYCSDLVIKNWSQNNLSYNDFNITGVEKITNIANYQITKEDNTNPYNPITYIIEILAIHNLTKFIEIVDLTLLQKNDYSQEDILLLDVNYSYFVDEYSAKKYDYNKDEILTNELFGDTSSIMSFDFVSSFKNFPGLPIYKTSLLHQNRKYLSFVTNYNTADFIENSTTNNYVAKSDSLLIKLKSDTEEQQVINDIKSIIKTDIISYNSQIEDLKTKTVSFEVNFLFIMSLITFAITVFVGYISAQNVILQRITGIRLIYRVGANRKQIFDTLFIEYQFILLLPFIIGFIVGSSLSGLIGRNLFSLQQVYNHFATKIPWWLVILLALLMYLGFNTSWFLKIKSEIRKFKFIKEE